MRRCSVMNCGAGGHFENLVCVFRVDCGDVGIVGRIQQAGLQLFQTEAGALVPDRGSIGVRGCGVFYGKVPR